MYKEIIPYHYCSSPSIKEEERWKADEPIVIRLDIIREIVPKANCPYVTLKITEDCFDDIVIKSDEAEEIKNILLGNILEKQGQQEAPQIYETEDGEWSEDEKIKKGIIKSIMDLNTDWLELHGVTKKNALSWLERQCKENPLKGTLGDVFDDLRAGLDPSPKQDEQKPAEWSEEDERTMNWIIEDMRSTISSGIIPKGGYVGSARNAIDWLISLKDRLKRHRNYSFQ